MGNMTNGSFYNGSPQWTSQRTMPALVPPDPDCIARNPPRQDLVEQNTQSVFIDGPWSSQWKLQIGRNPLPPEGSEAHLQRDQRHRNDQPTPLRIANQGHHSTKRN